MARPSAFALAPALCARAPRSQWISGSSAVCRRISLSGHAGVPSRRARRAISMLLDALSESMSGAVRRLRGVDRISESNVRAPLKEVRRALLDGDVNLRVVTELLKKVRARAVGAVVPPGVEPGQLLVKIMHEELTAVMGGARAELAGGKDAGTIVLLAGLQGAGKTTAAGKLAVHCRKAGRTVALVAADVHRPAAAEQLRALGERAEVSVFPEGQVSGMDAVAIVKKGIAEAKASGADTIIVDTAGRQVIDEGLMRELKEIQRVANAEETLLVVDAMTGQEAAAVARAFSEAVPVTGCVLTKLDGDTRGGAALSVRLVSGAPIKFVGVGERLDALEAFYPERMASRILGMGDVLTLVERAQSAFDEREATRMTQKMMERTFDFDDFMKQTKAVSQMGSLGGLMKMMPGVGAQLTEEKIAAAEMKMKLADSLIKSMTPRERRTPDLLYSAPSANSRLARIARGSGRSDTDARNLISDFQRMRTMMARMSKQMLGDDPNNPNPEAAIESRASRVARRRAAKKKALRGGPKRGFG